MSTKNAVTREERKLKKQKRKALLKSVLAIIMALLLIAITISPIFAESQVAFEDVKVVSDYEMIGYTVQAAEQVTEDYKGYIDFMTQTIQNSYYKEVPLRTLIDGAYKGLFEGLDPYSTYFTPKEYADFNTSIAGEFGGIGASVTEGKSGYVEVVSPIKGTPAEAAGLLPGDKIYKIDGVDATGFTTEKAVTLIRGDVGTKVVLTIIREGLPEPFEVEIIRAMIRIKSVEYEVLENNVGYIKLSDFSDKTIAEFDAAVKALQAKGVTKLILDLRNNPGGLLDVATYIGDYFLPYNEEIVKIDYRVQNDRVYKANKDKSPFELAVLINKGSASASEIVAGSIKQAKVGTIVGETSFGKGTVQTLMPLNNGGAVKLTIAEYKLKGNYTVNGVGIVPDLESKSLRGIDTSELAPIRPASQNTSLNIYAAQERLNLMMGLSIKPDGLLSEETLEAVKAFQAKAGLSQTGMLSKATLEALVTSFENQVSGKEDTQLQKAIEVLVNK